MEIHADVEAAVIPFRFMVSAPSPVFIHLGDVPIDYPAVFAEPRHVVVNAATIRFQSAITIASIVPIRTCRSSPREQHPSGQRGA